MTSEVVLITGAGGYVGRRLVHRYLKTTESDLLLLLRSAARRDEIAAELGPLAQRVQFVFGDLETPDPFTALDGPTTCRVTSIVHAAAVTRFNAERSVAFRANVDGTARVLELARRCPALTSFGHVSSVYSTGLIAGSIRERLVPDQPEFANAYEESKWAAEQLVGDAADLPWRILRVATVLADNDGGSVSQYNAVHDTLKLVFYGLLSVVPGVADTPLYFVTGDFVTGAIVDLMSPATPSGVYHLAHAREDSVALGSLIDLAYAQFTLDQDFRRKRILRPLLADEGSFSLLVDGMSPIAGGLMATSLRDVAPFARQLYVCKDVDNSRLRQWVDGYLRPDTAELVARTCGHLVRTRWGRRDVA